MNIVLDMDATLIHTDEANMVIHPRPHLKEFLHYLFSKFDNVSVWTHATDEWFSIAFNSVIKEHMPPNEEFHFVWTRRTCVIDRGMVRKPLERVYAKFMQYNILNTFVVDDNPDTYALNVINAIAVNPFTGDPKDQALLSIMEFFETGIFSTADSPIANAMKESGAFDDLEDAVSRITLEETGI